MAHELLAPWAQIVPDAPFPMTIAEMQALPEDRWQYELVDGQLVRGPWSGFRKSVMAAKFLAALVTYVRPRGLGVVTGANGLYNLTAPHASNESALIPDAAFVRAELLPGLRRDSADDIPHIAPDLVAEIGFSHQTRGNLAAKARLYLEAGVRLVWIVWPDDEQVEVWQAGSDAVIATLGAHDQLDGLDVLPGFSYPVADLFTE